MISILPLSASSEPTSSSGTSGSSGGGIGTGLIIGVTAGGLAFAIIVVMVLILVLWRRHGGHWDVARDVHMYDYVGPPEPPSRRPAEIASNILQMEQNAAYASNIQTEQNAAYASNILADRAECCIRR